jgi:transcription termination factor Rho
MEINLTRKLANRRTFPAFDLLSSGTRREELLLPEDELNKIWVLRKLLANMNTIEGMELIIEKMRRYKTNFEFFEALTGKKNGQHSSGSES